MKAINYLVILSASLCIFNSCTKDVAGPAGPTGPPGAQGASASYYVTIDSVAATIWQPDGTGTFYDAQISVPSLTSPNNSIVEVYFSQTYNAHSTWYALPAYNTPVGGSGDEFQFYYYLYNVVIEYSPSAPLQQLYFKVVVITNP